LVIVGTQVPRRYQVTLNQESGRLSVKDERWFIVSARPSRSDEWLYLISSIISLCKALKPLAPCNSYIQGWVNADYISAPIGSINRSQEQ
jgi:hypothetical protein